MNPRLLERRVESDFVKDGYLVQRALFSLKHLPGGRIISHQSDFFGVWDLIAVKPGECVLIQVCSGGTLKRHMNLIDKTFPHTTWAKQVLRYYYKNKGRWAFTNFVRLESGWVIDNH